jgi:hypothetical protein
MQHAARIQLPPLIYNFSHELSSNTDAPVAAHGIFAGAGAGDFC